MSCSNIFHVYPSCSFNSHFIYVRIGPLYLHGCCFASTRIILEDTDILYLLDHSVCIYLVIHAVFSVMPAFKTREFISSTFMLYFQLCLLLGETWFYIYLIILIAITCSFIIAFPVVPLDCSLTIILCYHVACSVFIKNAIITIKRLWQKEKVLEIPPFHWIANMSWKYYFEESQFHKEVTLLPI